MTTDRPCFALMIVKVVFAMLVSKKRLFEWRVWEEWGEWIQIQPTANSDSDDGPLGAIEND